MPIWSIELFSLLSIIFISNLIRRNDSVFVNWFKPSAIRVKPWSILYDDAKEEMKQSV